MCKKSALLNPVTFSVMGSLRWFKRRCVWKVLSVVIPACFVVSMVSMTPKLVNMTEKSTSGASPRQTIFVHRETQTTVGDYSTTTTTFVEEYIKDNNPLILYFHDNVGDKAPIHTPYPQYFKMNIAIPLKLILILRNSLKSLTIWRLQQFYVALKIEFRIRVIQEPLPPLVLQDLNAPMYSLVVFDDYSSYLMMDPKQRAILDEYCKKYGIGMFSLTQPELKNVPTIFPNFHLHLQHKTELYQYKMNDQAGVWRIAKPNVVYQNPLPVSDWTLFVTDHPTYHPLVTTYSTENWTEGVGRPEDVHNLAIYDAGSLDGVKRIILGHDLSFWLDYVVVLDAMHFLTGGRITTPIERLLQVDVDDMFVGIDMKGQILVSDALAMRESQEKIRRIVPNFKYTLGFSGGTYQPDRNHPQGSAGYKKFIELAEHFAWFDHMYQHEQPHLMNLTDLRISMSLNLDFARSNLIPMMNEYMVTPHHSGVYPVDERLFETWIKDRGVICTSTEEYPKHRRGLGFMHRGIMVLPRQTCRGLLAMAMKFSEFPGGKKELDECIQGGDYFITVLSRTVMIFMTHMPNFAADHMAQYTFENLVEFVDRWTNLKILAPTPAEIGRRYFALNPQEVTPVWTNPCRRQSHLMLWSQPKTCTKFPRFIIVGPQKTGTTALYTFLDTHPKLNTSILSPSTYEEIQFFNGDNYLHGIEWYLKHFLEPKDQETINYEKSATYFDSLVTPRRMSTLLPDVYIVAILSDPSLRAYSWYQHLRSHGDAVAVNNTFLQVLQADNTPDLSLKNLRNRCLIPGMYAVHLARWLLYFNKTQIHIIDGAELRSNPATVVNRLQIFVRVQPFIDYKTKLHFDDKKGFYCLVEEGCLSENKGRKYPPMDAESEQYLHNFYKDHNTNLKTLLTHIDHPFPSWLK